MTPVQPDFETDDLGECNIASPFRGIFMDASNRVLFRTNIDELRAQIRAGVDPPAKQRRLGEPSGNGAEAIQVGHARPASPGHLSRHDKVGACEVTGRFALRR
jgi:hypothetical protein